MIQTQENTQKRHFGPDLGPLDSNSGRQNFFKKLQARTKYLRKTLVFM